MVWHKSAIRVRVNESIPILVCCDSALLCFVNFCPVGTENSLSFSCTPSTLGPVHHKWVFVIVATFPLTMIVYVIIWVSPIDLCTKILNNIILIRLATRGPCVHMIMVLKPSPSPPLTRAALIPLLGNIVMALFILGYLGASCFGGHVCFKNPQSIEGGQRAFIGYGRANKFASGLARLAILTHCSP